MRYWLDADVLINAKNGPYPMRNARGFWSALAGKVEEGSVAAPKRVFDEVTEGRKLPDELAAWMKLRKEKGLCIKANGAIDAYATAIGDYIFGGRYPVSEALKFSKGGDPWLIAYALHYKGVVVSNESNKFPKSDRVRIPDVCHEFAVRCITLDQLIVEIDLQF
jgi:hypothetical protein